MGRHNEGRESVLDGSSQSIPCVLPPSSLFQLKDLYAIFTDLGDKDWWREEVSDSEDELVWGRGRSGWSIGLSGGLT